MFVEVSSWTEFIRIFVEDGAVMVAVPDVGWGDGRDRSQNLARLVLGAGLLGKRSWQVSTN